MGTHATHDLRRQAKQHRFACRHGFSAVGSLEHVAWATVAYYVLCSVNPLLDKEYGTKLAAAGQN